MLELVLLSLDHSLQLTNLCLIGCFLSIISNLELAASLKYFRYRLLYHS